MEVEGFGMPRILMMSYLMEFTVSVSRPFLFQIDMVSWLLRIVSKIFLKIEITMPLISF